VSKKLSAGLFGNLCNGYALLASILRAIFFKRKFIIVLNEKYLYSPILNLFEYITQNSFNADLSIVSKDDYNATKENYKDFIIFHGQNIINDTDTIFDPKKLNFEKSVIEQFISKSNSILSIALLKDEIRKTFIITQSVSEFIKNYRKKEKLSTKIVANYLKDAYNFKKEKNYKNYLNWILNIVNKYFGTKFDER